MASLKIHKQNPEAVMVVAPSDHWIEDESAFISNLQSAFDFSEKSDVLMTLGINQHLQIPVMGILNMIKQVQTR